MMGEIGKNGYDIDENLKRAIKKHRELAESIRERIVKEKESKAAEEFNKAKEC